MKKTILAVFLLISIYSYSHSYVLSSVITKARDVRHISSSKVPAAVINNFNSMYPGAANVRWNIITGAYAGHTQYMAEFKLNDAKRTARYSPDGTYLGGS